MIRHEERATIGPARLT